METLKMARAALLHPVDFCYDLQLPDRPLVRRALVMIALAIAARLLSLSLSAYLFQTKEAYQISAVTEGLWIVVLWLTWSVANWGVSAIREGEAKFKELLVGSAFAFTPYIVFSVPLALLSNVLTLTESSLYSLLSYGILGWVFLLLLVQTKILHDFELSKLLFITLLTMIGMLIIWFVFILIYGLVGQAVNFVLGLIKEIRYQL